MAVRRSFVTLRDGRRLAYAALGAPADTAKAVAIYHHGWPSSSQEAIVCGESAAALGVHMITFDRPGIGGSSHNPGLCFRAVAEDVRELMDALGLESAIQIGTSGGAPHAAACAALLGPSRVPSLVLVAPTTHTRGPGARDLWTGMDPFQKAGYTLMETLPGVVVRVGIAATIGVSRLLIYPFSWVAVRCLESGGGGSARSSSDGGGKGRRGVKAKASDDGSSGAVTKAAAAAAPAGDGGAVKPLTVGAASGGMSLRDAAAGGLTLINDILGAPMLADGWWQDMELTSNPWAGEFEIESITVPTLVVRGEKDTCVTAPMAAYLAEHIPGTRTPAALAAAAALRAALPLVGSAAVEGGKGELYTPGAARVEVMGRGHISLVVGCMGPVLSAVAAALPARPGATA